jgi:hypothetical protein
MAKNYSLTWDPASVSAGLHVATTGSDSNPGTSALPWLTIQHALSVATAGATINVHAGTYREQLDPPRGGTSDLSRIRLQAATGETVNIRGSERITSWSSLGGGKWSAAIANTFFGSWNPYTNQVGGGNSNSTGAVYLDGVPYTEVGSTGALTASGLWTASVSGGNTTITAHFGAANPNTQLAEINVRRTVLTPTTEGLGYITLYGLNFQHAATIWSDPDGANRPQRGALATNYGHNWLIERCYVGDSTAIGISLGLGDATDANVISDSGSHIIRYCTVERCGEGGINGSHNAVVSTVEYCLIQDCCTLTAGAELAGLKFHTAIDMIIRGNVIRRCNNGFGLWLDWQSMGTRVTGNVIDAAATKSIYLEADHGPTLVDNNVLVGDRVYISESNVEAFNLLINSSVGVSGDGRTPSLFTPHTITDLVGATVSPQYDRSYGNIFVNSGGLSTSGTNAGGSNVSYSSGAGAASVTHNSTGCVVQFTADTAPVSTGCPVVNATLIGTLQPSNCSIEDHTGAGITVSTDALGVARGASPTAGPWQVLPSGINSRTYSAGQAA